MRVFLSITLCLSLLLPGCKTQEKQPTSIFRQPNWWERRMDRLETWNMRHGYPIEKTKEAIGNTLIVVGATACVVGYFWLNCQPDSTVPFNDPNWSPGR